MKHITITLLCFLLSASSTYARFFSIGPRIGASISQVHLTKGNKALTGLLLENDWGYHVGIFTRLALFGLYVQPEILFTSSGAKFSKNNKTLLLGLTQLAIPTMVGCYFFRVVRIQIGPVFSLLLSAEEDKKDVKKHYSNTTIGWQGGLGFDAWNMVFDLQYARSISRFGNEIAGMRTNHGYGLWILSIGVNVL
jgi:Outer membrane protein beta-barrel domain